MNFLCKNFFAIFFSLIAFIVMIAAVQPPNANAMEQKLHRGINIYGDDPIWINLKETRFKPEFYREIHDSGFDFVRVAIPAFGQIDRDGKLSDNFMNILEKIVYSATKANLAVIIDEHDYRICGRDSERCLQNLIIFWKAIAQRFHNFPDNVYFEVLNEPNGDVTPDRWNYIINNIVPVIRDKNPERKLIIGPANFNSFKYLNRLALPFNDHNIIVSVHYYDPIIFTYQGAKWIKPSLEEKTGVPWNYDQGMKQIDNDFSYMKRWSEEHNLPIMIGEFGVYEKAPMDDRVKWIKAIVSTAEVNNFPWCYWQFENNFAAFDIKNGVWNRNIYNALFKKW